MEVTAEGWQHLSRIDEDDSLVRKHGLTAGSYVLAVSSPTPNKNFDLVVRAMRRLRDLPLRFVVAGAADSRVLVARRVAGEGLVTEVGYVSDSQLKSLYANALCFVFPSKYEGFGIPALEAMALGCPVVASSIDATREVCGDAASYVDPADDAALERVLRCLHGSRETRATMIEKGRERARMFAWSTSAKKSISAVISCVRAEV
jgi:glycosyltransferase involved in cell wall biosynthesis